MPAHLWHKPKELEQVAVFWFSTPDGSLWLHEVSRKEKEAPCAAHAKGGGCVASKALQVGSRNLHH